MLFSCSLTSIIHTSALVSFSTGSPETLVTQSWMASVMWGTTTTKKKHLPVVGSYPNTPKRSTYSLEGLKILSLIVSVSRPYLHFELNWAIQENILTIPRTAFQNSKGKGAIFELEIWRHGVFSHRISTGERRVYSLKTLIKLELMTLLTTSEAGYKTSIHQSVMFLCSFVEENQQNVGWNWAPEALTLQNILFLLVKQPHKLFCPFNAKHGLLSKDAIFNFWSSCDWERLLTPKSKIQDDGNENTIDCVNLPSVHTVIKGILILMFCTSLGEC